MSNKDGDQKRKHPADAHAVIRHRAEHGVRHNPESRHREGHSTGPHRACTVNCPTHFVCSTPGRFGAINRAGYRGQGAGRRLPAAAR